MESLTAVGAPIRHGQFVDGETVFSALVFHRTLGSRVDQHPLPHPLHLSSVQTHLHLQSGLTVLLSGDWSHFLGEKHLWL